MRLQSGGNPEEIRPQSAEDPPAVSTKVKIESLLTDTQKKQWNELLGKPLALDE